MSDDQWSRVEQIYHAALERTPEERAGFIAQACSSDSGLRREVESLLVYHGRGDALLEAKGVRRVIGAMIAINLEPGASIGPYKILAQAGKGGMGEVYKARDVRLNRIVAIKVLPYQFGIGLDRRSRMEREAKAIASINHPHICALFDIGEQNDLEYLVMEYLEGETLASRLKRGALPISEALRIAIQILEALKHAHRRAIVHRDLKPSNVMLTANGIKLLDFGLAKMLDRASQPSTDDSATPLGAIVGTLPYMAPEQLERRAVDERADIYAFGAVLYEMLTGHRAFEAETQAALISAIMTKQPPALHLVKLYAPRSESRFVRAGSLATTTVKLASPSAAPAYSRNDRENGTGLSSSPQMQLQETLSLPPDKATWQGLCASLPRPRVQRPKRIYL